MTDTLRNELHNLLAENIPHFEAKCELAWDDIGHHCPINYQFENEMREWLEEWLSDLDLEELV